MKRTMRWDAGIVTGLVVIMACGWFGPARWVALGGLLAYLAVALTRADRRIDAAKIASRLRRRTGHGRHAGKHAHPQEHDQW